MLWHLVVVYMFNEVWGDQSMKNNSDSQNLMCYTVINSRIWNNPFHSMSLDYTSLDNRQNRNWYTCNFVRDIYCYCDNVDLTSVLFSESRKEGPEYMPRHTKGRFHKSKWLWCHCMQSWCSYHLCSKTIFLQIKVEVYLPLSATVTSHKVFSPISFIEHVLCFQWYNHVCLV